MKKIIIGLLSLVLLVLVGIGIIKASNEEWMPLVVNDTSRERTMMIFAKGDTYFELYDDIDGNKLYVDPSYYRKRDGYNMVLDLPSYNYLNYPHMYLKIYGDKKDIHIEDGTTFERALKIKFNNPNNPNQVFKIPWLSPLETISEVNLINNKGYMFDVAGISNLGSDSIEIYDNSYRLVDNVNKSRIYFKAEYTGTYYIKLKGTQYAVLELSVQEWLHKNQNTINYGDSGELNYVYKINRYRDLYLESNNINEYIIDNNSFRNSLNNKYVVSPYYLKGDIVNLTLKGNKNETSDLTLRDGSSFSNAYPYNIKDDGDNLNVLLHTEKGRDAYFEEYFDDNLSYQLDFGQSKQLIIYDSNEHEVYRTESYDTLEYPNYKRNITFKPTNSGTYYIRVILPEDNNGSTTNNNVFLSIGKVYPLDTNLNIIINNDSTTLNVQNMYGYHLIEGRTYIFNLKTDKAVGYRIFESIDGGRSYNEGYNVESDTIIFKPEKTQNYFFKFTGENGTQISLENSGGLTGLQAFSELRKQGHSPVNALTLLYDPIDTSSGALLIDKDLLQYYSFNPLQFNIHYNSLLLEEGSMGKGWNHDFDIKLVQDYRYSYGYIVKWNQNNFTIFDKQTDGTYKSSDPQFVGAVLSENPYVYQGFNLVLKDGSSYKFSEGKLKEYRNSKQDVFEYTYGAYDKVSQVYQPSTQHKLNLFYNSQGLLEKVTDNLNREVLFEYTGNLLTKFTDANGNDFSYTYNNQGQILTGTDSNGVEYLKNVYDTFGRITEQTDGMGNTSTLNYDDISSPDEIITTTTNREGDTKTLVHSATTHQLIKTIDEMGKIREFSYDSAGNLIKETDEDGNVYSKGYDSLNNLISSINPLNEEVKLGYTDNKLSSIQIGIYGEIKNVYDGNNLTQIEDALKNKTTFTYNAAGLPLSKTDSLNNTTNYTYKNGQLSSITDPENHTTYFEYDAVGRLSNQVDANGNRYEYQYDNNSNVVSIKDPLYEQTFSYNNYNKVLTEKNKAGVTTSYNYNNNGQLIKSQIGEQTTRYERDKEDRIIKLIDSKGLETSWAYSPSGYITLEKNANNEEIQINYDNRYNIIQKIINGNISNSYKYDALNRVIEETDSENKTTKYEYQGDNLVKVINPDGSYYSYTYDLNNSVLTTTDNLENEIQYSYNEVNNLKTWTDANGNTTTYNYDGNYAVTSIVDPLNHSKSIQYDSNGNAVAVTNELNETTHQNYDALNRLTSVTDALGNTVRYEYDALSNVTAIYDASGKKVKGYSYDNYNNLTSEIDALGQTYQYQYDLNNNLSKIIDPLDRVQEQSVDNVGRVVSVIDTNNIESSQSLNIYDEITSITNPNQFTTSLLYNKSGQILQETNSLGTSNHYGYNSAGQLSSYKNYRGQEATYEFEGGRLKKISDNVGTIEYTYDNNSNVTEINENGKTLKYQYNALNHLVSYTDENNFTISYEYDAAGQLVKLIYPFDKEVLYSYDAVGNLKDVTDWNNSVTSYLYDVNNRLISTLKPDGSQELREYDDKGQVISLKNISANGEIISNDTMVYNAVGNVTAENNKNYTYDSLDRLINVGNFDNSDDGISYKFDNAGNITSITSVTKSVYEDYENISVTDSVYEEENDFTTVTDSVYFNYDPDNRLISYNGITLNYDADGNLLSIPKNDDLLNATYDSRNRLIQVGSTEYIYNSENQRTGIVENGVQKHFVINPNATFSQLLVETDGDGNPTSFYVYGLGLISKEDVSSNTYYYHFDKRGSTIALTNSVGSITDTYEYDEYGVILNYTGTTENSFKYVGQYGVVTDDNGLYFMRSRYYHPELKRFINQDTVTGDIYFAQTLNRYSYVNGNPISYIDPLGTTRTLDNIHNTLDVAGFIPGVGIVADVLNGVVYLATGNWGYASLSLVAAVPVIGDMAAAGKIGLKTISHVDELSDAYKLEKCLACFTSGTHIATKQGQKPIEDIKIGDEVLSKNEDTGEIAYKPVTNLFRKTITETYNIIIGNETITTSNYHPFYVQGQGWTFAKDLRSGDLLVNDNGQTLKIDDIIIKKETKVVYNFEVADFHTYFVSNLGVWTHNSSCLNLSWLNQEKYQAVNYFGTTKVNGIKRDISRRVYQKTDIDWNFIDSRTGLTNSQLIKKGNAPIGIDGEPIQLHHTIQEEPGPIVEILGTKHREYYNTLHGLKNDGESFRNIEELEKQYNNFQKKYWRWRYKNL